MSLLDVHSLVTRLYIDGALVPVVRGVSFSVERGEVLGIVGESGSGKTVTARSLMRLLPRGASVEGQVLLGGMDVISANRAQLKEIRSRRCAMIFQDPRAYIHPLYRCGDFLDEGLVVHGQMGRKEAKTVSLRMLSSVGIVDPERVYGSYPGQLSGGMLQRVMIAGALTLSPDLLIADEPTTALDVTIQAEIMALLDRLRRERQMTCIFITHDLDLASMVCDRIMVMYAGLVVESRMTDDLFSQPLHPYTAGLLEARPSVENRRDRLAVIPGRPPTPGKLPSGCAFHPRCSLAQEKCALSGPTLSEVGTGSLAACWRVGELSRGRVDSGGSTNG